MKILCATDLLSTSDWAIDRAGMLSDCLRADLSILHVVRPTESNSGLQQDLERASKELRFKVGPALWRYHAPPSIHVRAGNPMRVLVETLEELVPDLLVLGRHRSRSAWDAIAGTIAATVLSECRYPVLIVDRRPWHTHHNIVLALDRTPASVEALRVAEAFVVNHSVRSVIVHAYQPVNDAIDSEVSRSDSEVALRARLMLASKDFSRYELRVENGTPVDVIQAAIHRVRPDLLVLGTRERLSRMLFGSVANSSIATARCDVLVVPDRKQSTTLSCNRVDRRNLEAISGFRTVRACSPPRVL